MERRTGQGHLHRRSGPVHHDLERYQSDHSHQRATRGCLRNQGRQREGEVGQRLQYDVWQLRSRLCQRLRGHRHVARRAVDHRRRALRRAQVGCQDRQPAIVENPSEERLPRVGRHGLQPQGRQGLRTVLSDRAETVGDLHRGS